jgi:hypothetical protein
VYSARVFKDVLPHSAFNHVPIGDVVYMMVYV